MTLTQILQKIKSVFYTKAEIDSMGGGSSLDTTIKSKASDSDVVHKSGNEVIDGTKTFNSQIKGTIDKSKDYYLTDNTLASANGSLGTVKYYPHGSNADLDTEIFEHSLWSSHVVANSIPNALDSFYYIDQYFYSTRTATSNRIQILRGYRNPSLHMVRVYDGLQTNSWSEWVKFASDSDVVHKSGSETVSGFKTFSDGFTINKPSPRLQTKSTTYSSETSSTMTIGDIAFLGKNGGFSSWIVDQLRDDLTKRLCFRVFSHNGGGYKGFAFDENCTLYAENTNSALGSSIYKWKTINGVSPSALSLPNLSEAIDISASLDTSQSSENTYIPPSDGYISILGRSASTCGIVIKTDSLFASMSYSVFDFGNTDKVSCCMCPVFKDQTVTIWLKSITSLDSAKFFPCQGNV